MPATLSRTGASKASLAAKAGLVVAALAVAAAAWFRPEITSPDFQPVDPRPQIDGQVVAVRPVNFPSMSTSLMLAGEFPPPPQDPTQPEPDEGTLPPGSPVTPGESQVTFLGAIAEPGRFVALLNINGRQKFLRPGDSYEGVRVIECSASQVQVQFEGAAGESARQTIAVSERTGPGWTEAVPPSASIEPGMEAPAGDGTAPAPIPGMPGNFVPPQGPMTPEQIQTIQREMERRAAQQGRDGSS